MNRKTGLKVATGVVVAILGLGLSESWQGLLKVVPDANQSLVEAISFSQDPNKAPSFTQTAVVTVSKSAESSSQQQTLQLTSTAVSNSLPPPNTSITPSASSSICRAEPLDHVWKPERLQVVEPCKTVTGNIEHIVPMPDGDIHIGLELDPQFANLVNDCNRHCLFGINDGNLVVEVVCVVPAIFPKEARATCKGYDDNVHIPLTFGHVSVTGTYAKDLEHGWMEIHPAWEIKKIP